LKNLKTYSTLGASSSTHCIENQSIERRKMNPPRGKGGKLVGYMSRHSGPLKTIKLVKELGLNELGKI
jgi:hypothetical protein